MKNLLEVEDLVIEFDTPRGRRRVVDGVSFQLAEGEVLGILGESGSGKTMTTMAVLGLVAGKPGVMSGRIDLNQDGQRVALLDGLERLVKGASSPLRKNSRKWDKIIHRRMRPLWGCAMTAVFQNPRLSLDPLMTVGAQVDESIRLARPGLTKAACRAAAVEWLAKVQMNDPARIYTSYPHELSGGMCQRAMIAVALARAPRLLIADEPTTGLDTTVRAEIVDLFQELLAEQRRSMLYISHDIKEVLYLADRVLIMRHGKVLETQTAHDLRYGVGERHEYTQSLLSAADLRPPKEAA